MLLTVAYQMKCISLYYSSVLVYVFGLQLLTLNSFFVLEFFHSLTRFAHEMDVKFYFLRKA